GAHPARGRGAPERHDPFRKRSQDRGPRRPLQGSRPGKPLRGGWELLRVERRRQSRAHDHGQRVARRGSPRATPGLRLQAMRRGGAMALRIAALGAALVLSGGPAAPAQEPDAPARGDAVPAVALTGSAMDRSVDFFSRVLGFEKQSDVEVAGGPYERLQGVFGVRLRVVAMGLGDERLELHEYLAPRGRPIPPDARSNDRSFQHIAIVVSDMA